jgi:hypothetical protein
MLHHKNAEELRPGDHVCSMFETDESRYLLLAAFVQSGFTKNERVLCFTYRESPVEVINALRSHGINIDTYIRRGQFSVGTAGESYFSDGEFDSDAVSERWGMASQLALEDGFSALRVAGNMGWATRNSAANKMLVSYEQSLQEAVFDRFPITGMCEFDMRMFGQSWSDRIAGLHPCGCVQVNPIAARTTFTGEINSSSDSLSFFR